MVVAFTGGGTLGHVIPALTVYEKPVGGKTRKYYSITKKGRGVLEEKQEEWGVYSRAVSHVMQNFTVEMGGAV